MKKCCCGVTELIEGIEKTIDNSRLFVAWSGKMAPKLFVKFCGLGLEGWVRGLKYVGRGGPTRNLDLCRNTTHLFFILNEILFLGASELLSQLSG